MSFQFKQVIEGVASVRSKPLEASEVLQLHLVVPNNALKHLYRELLNSILTESGISPP